MIRDNAKFALDRRQGMSPDKARALVDEMNSHKDLYANCPKCGATIRGTIERLKRGCDCAETSTDNS